MKILLVQLPTSYLGAGEKVYPLGLSRLSTTLPPFHEKQVLDMNVAMDPWPELKKKIQAFRHSPLLQESRSPGRPPGILSLSPEDRCRPCKSPCP